MKEGWEIKKLGDVCEVIGGGTPSKVNSKFYNGNIFWATVRDMKGDIIRDTEHKITEEAVKNSSTNIIPRGNVIIATRVGLGKTCLIENDTAINQDLRGIIPRKNSVVFTGFLFQWFKSISHFIVKEGTGATVQGVKLPFIKDLPIPLPPLPEQKRIVATLDKAFAALAKAKENAEQNLKNAKELFESYLQEVFENKGEGWEFTKLKHNIDLLTGFAFKSKYYTDKEEDVLLLRGDNIMQGEFRWKDAKRWKISEYYKFEKYQLQEHDIVLAMDRPWVNAGLKCARVSKTDLPSLLVQRTACLRNNSKINNSFLYYLIKSKGFMDYLLDVQMGIGVPHISGKQIFNFTFNRPSINKQKIIVKKLNALSDKTNKLEAIYQQKIADLEELQKSILQKAFNGEL
jgi:type I restriction enzyme, S subunit